MKLFVGIGITFSLHASINPPLDKQDLKDRKYDFFANFIYWTMRESGADNWAEVITSEGSSSSNVLEPVDFGWDPGFRVGMGTGKNFDLWDLQIYYTWFYTRGSDSISSVADSVHSTFLGNFYIDNPDGAGLSGPSYQKASIHWTVRFNMFDWELGRNFQQGEPTTFRPFLGIKGGWIDQSINSKWENPSLSGDEFFPVGTENLKNNFFGIGPQIGIHSKWYLFTTQNQFFCLFGDFSGAFMWGHWSFGDVFKNDLPQKVLIDFAPVNGGASMFRSFMGLGWQSQNRVHFSIKLGYETQFWLDQLQFYSFTAGRFSNALTLQGGTFEFYLDY